MAAKGRAAGVLPINAAATKKDKPSQNQSKSSPRTPAPKLRLIVRRLPPGLLESEFWEALGDEWRVGKGKIDWAAFKEGKISKDPSKPSRPARGYLKVKDSTLLEELSNKVKQTPFQDAKNTTRDPCLIGPPSLEFAPLNKIASGRSRNDGRQGTIDQDQEFIDFLQSLTEPINKATANGTDNDAAQEKITTTPLVQYLKEKKANKAKEAAEKKSAKAKQQDSKDAKQPKSEKVVVKSATRSPEKGKVAKASQEAVKAITKSVAQIQAKPAAATPASKGDNKTSTKDSPATATPAKRDRPNISAAARIQRDLGLAPKAPRAGRGGTTAATPSVPPTGAKAEANVKAVEKSSASKSEEKKPTPAKGTTSSTTPANAPTPTGPRATRGNAPAAPVVPTPPVAPKAVPAPRAKPAPQPSNGAKSAFLKHANPSQGVTEELLRAAFTTFGTVTRCEIDKKKGLGYIDFEDTEGLKKAMAASPVKVGDKGGQVVVLENKNLVKGNKITPQKPSATAPSAATTNAAKANAPVASPKLAPVAPSTTGATQAPVATTCVEPAAAAPAANATAVKPTSNETADAGKQTAQTPPTAPRNSNKGGQGGGRGGRAANAQGGRGGGGRGEGRGGKGGRRGRGGAAAVAAAGGEASAPTPAPAAATDVAPKADNAAAGAGGASAEGPK